MRHSQKFTIWMFCIPEFARGIFATMIANYLVFFYQPTDGSNLPVLITQGAVFIGLTVIGLIKSIGHIIDAVTDPLIANLSDRSKNRNGRRVPFMKWFAIPYALSCFLIFFAPDSVASTFNNLWVGFFIWAYFIFFTLYSIPHSALLPEMVTEPKARVNAYTISSFMYVTGSAFGYAATVLVTLLENSGMASLTSWRVIFGIYTIIGMIMLFVPTFFLDEKLLVKTKKPATSLWLSIKMTFKNAHFRTITIAQLLESVAMGIFQTCMLFYVTELLHLPKSMSFVIFAISIGGSLVMYPLINKLAKKHGKKILMITACAVFAASQFAIFIFAKIPNIGLIGGILMGIFVSYPFAVFNILPGAMMADIIQESTITTGVNQEGMFGAAKSFITKMGNSFALVFVPSLLMIGAQEGSSVGLLGLELIALISGALCALSIVAFFFYKEHLVKKTIADEIKKQAELEETTADNAKEV